MAKHIRSLEDKELS